MAGALWRCRARGRYARAPVRLTRCASRVRKPNFVGGPFRRKALLDGIDFVAFSPGLAPQRELASIIPAAQERGIALWGEIELFAQALAALKTERDYAPKLIAITGTNGKTTVTSMVGLPCASAPACAPQVAGNISPAALDVLREALDANDLPQAWVLELSSFQLAYDADSLQADAATVLNLTQDHLDWHGDMQAYAADKARIFGAHTVRVLNRDDPEVMRMASPLAPVMSFGLDEPEQANCFGLVNENGMQWLSRCRGGRRRREKAPQERRSRIAAGIDQPLDAGRRAQDSRAA